MHNTKQIPTVTCTQQTERPHLDAEPEHCLGKVFLLTYLSTFSMKGRWSTLHAQVHLHLCSSVCARVHCSVSDAC